MIQRRTFKCTKDGNALRYYVYKDEEGALTASAEEVGDVRAHKIRLEGEILGFAERLFEHEETDSEPHLVLDLPPITESDVEALLCWPNCVVEQINLVNQIRIKLDLCYPTHQAIESELLRIAEEFTQVGRTFCILQARITKAKQGLTAFKDDTPELSESQRREATNPDICLAASDDTRNLRTSSKIGSWLRAAIGIFISLFAMTRP